MSDTTVPAPLLLGTIAVATGVMIWLGRRAAAQHAPIGHVVVEAAQGDVGLASTPEGQAVTDEALRLALDAALA